MSGCGGWESVNPICRVGQVLGTAAKHATNDVFGSIADYFAGVAKGAVTWLWGQLNSATSIDLTTAGVKSDLLATGAIALVITFALFLIQVITSTLRQDPGGMGRAVRGLAISFIGAAFAVAATQVLLAAVDGLCNGVVEFALGTDVSGVGSKLVTIFTLSQIGNPAGLLLISLVLILAVVVIWVALMIRKMLIIVSAVFAPIAFSGAASDVSKSWVRRWIEFTVALVFSKLILVIIFMIGLSVLNGAGQSGTSGGHSATNSITSLVIGALTLLLAGFAPWIAIKMVHFAGDSFHQVHAQGTAAMAGAQSAVAVPRKVASAVPHPAAQAAARSGAGGKGGAGGAGQSGAPPKSGSSGGGGGSGGGGAGGVLAGVGGRLGRGASAGTGSGGAPPALATMSGKPTQPVKGAATGGRA